MKISNLRQTKLKMFQKLLTKKNCLLVVIQANFVFNIIKRFILTYLTTKIFRISKLKKIFKKL